MKTVHRLKEIEMPVEHKERHIQLHKALDELVSDYSNQVRQSVLHKSVADLLDWSHMQTIGPDHPIKEKTK